MSWKQASKTPTTATNCALGASSDGETCLSCSGERMCWDCRGSGSCPHDGGDGLCVACGGGGLEVVNGPPVKPWRRVWLLRTDAGTLLDGRQMGRPNPNLRIMPRKGSRDPRAFTRSQVHPLTYFQAVRDYLERDDAAGHMELGTFAESGRLWPLATWAYRRAMSADPAVAKEALQALKLVEGRRVKEWLQEAAKAAQAEDRLRARHLLQLVRGASLGTADAKNAQIELFKLDAQDKVEREAMDDATRERIAAEDLARVERAIRAARTRLELSAKLLRRALEESGTDDATERLFLRADRAAWDAARGVLRVAHRHPPGAIAWSAAPVGLLVEIRRQRGRVQHDHAVRAVAAGRFSCALRLADRAAVLDPTNPLVIQVKAAAEKGVLRRGVLQGSPPGKTGDGPR